MNGVKEVALSHIIKILFKLPNNAHPHIMERAELRR